MKFREYVKQEGYVRYRGAVSEKIYEYFQCKDSSRAVWYHKKDSFQCVGCREQCETDSSEGFQLFLEL